MKKYLFIILFGFVLIGFILYTNFNQNKEVFLNENNKEEIKPTGMNSLAIMLQNEKGEYVVSDSDTWPTDEYVFNDVLSSCENGGKLSWNDGKITLKTSGSDKCYVYFDKISIIQNNNLQMLLAESKKMNQETVGELVHHTQDVPNSANDNAYRYSGNNPNNFICFGAGSEDYNNGKVETCELTNQYRIIGIVPVTTADGKQENLIKVIKSEYITEKELGKSKDDEYSVNYRWISNPRIQTTSGIHAFKWNEYENTWLDGEYNYWAKDGQRSTLNEALNNYYLNTTLGNNWTNKIEMVKWNVGGVDTTEYTASEMKNKEEDLKFGASIISIDKIGLMYAYDYGFASEQNSWTSTLHNYNNGENVEEKNKNGEHNWLFNGIDESIISRVFDTTLNIIIYDSSVVEHDGDGVTYATGIRPVFYLKSSVKLISDNKTDGTYLHPYRIG